MKREGVEDGVSYHAYNNHVIQCSKMHFYLHSKYTLMNDLRSQRLHLNYFSR